MYSLCGKRILLISPEPWEHLHVSKHQYAIHLAQNKNEVYFLNPPSGQLEISKSEFESLYVINYSGFWKGLRFFPKWLRKRNQNYVYTKIQRLIENEFDIVWSFDNSVFFDFDSLPKKVLKISHIVDLNQDFNTKLASTSADFCFGVIPKIVDRHRKHNPSSFLVTHGVSIKKEKPTPKVLPGGNNSKALYFGNLAMPHLNWELLFKAAKKHGKIDFVLIGSHTNIIDSQILKLANVHIVPGVPSDQLYEYMLAADLLFLFYTTEYYAAYASPHKLMEYLLSGKPIVASNYSGHDQLNELIYIAKSDNDWINLIGEVVGLVDEKMLISKRVQFSLGNSYDNKIQQIEQILVNHKD